MAALDVHHAIFINDKAFDLPLRSASSFLHPAPERDETPASHFFTSAVYQDLIQRQPTHPDGPMSGWDLGLNLLGDPITAVEHKSLEDHRTKLKLRRLYAMNIALELFFGIWGMYSTVRYFLAFVNSVDHGEHIGALVLGITSALAVALVITSVSMPLFPQHSHPRAWRFARSLFRACYLLLVSAGAVVNLGLVLVWHPGQFCGWDIDILWYTSNANTVTSPCHPVPYAAWIAAATLRLVVTWTMVLSFIYALRSYHKTRHPISEWNNSPYLPSDSEDISPVSSPSPLRLLKPTYKFIRSNDSDHTLNQSSVTLPKINSISTLAPSTSCHSRTPPPKDNSRPVVSLSTARRASTHVGSHGLSSKLRSETASHTQPVNAVAEPSPIIHMLRRTSRISITKVTWDATPSEGSSYPERLDGQSMRDSSEIRSWGLGHAEHRKMSLACENASVWHDSQASVGSASCTSTHDGGESVHETLRDRVEEDVKYEYGYGVSGPTYPYLDMYNPQRPMGHVRSTSYEDADEHAMLQGQRSCSLGLGFRDASPGPSSLARNDEIDEAEMESEASSGEEEEYVAMMGGFVRRMATIESLGSREAAGTLSTTTAATATGSVAHCSNVRCKTPESQFSSLRFAEYASSSGTTGLESYRESSVGTAYLSLSSGGTGMWVNELGELMPGPNANRSTADSSFERQYYTASGGSFPRTDEDRR